MAVDKAQLLAGVQAMRTELTGMNQFIDNLIASLKAVTPMPEATMWRMVSMELPSTAFCKPPSAAGGPMQLGQAATT